MGGGATAFAGGIGTDSCQNAVYNIIQAANGDQGIHVEQVCFVWGLFGWWFWGGSPQLQCWGNGDSQVPSNDAVELPHTEGEAHQQMKVFATDRARSMRSMRR